MELRSIRIDHELISEVLYFAINGRVKDVYQKCRVDDSNCHTPFPSGPGRASPHVNADLGQSRLDVCRHDEYGIQQLMSGR